VFQERLSVVLLPVQHLKNCLENMDVDPCILILCLLFYLLKGVVTNPLGKERTVLYTYCRLNVFFSRGFNSCEIPTITESTEAGRKLSDKSIIVPVNEQVPIDQCWSEGQTRAAGQWVVLTKIVPWEEI